ncbi:hypothetical protein KYY02_15445 [Streptomyces pimonensis]|uniref:GCN5-related N-acetyltransferase Rv2170-like domain-containing protein n=1 Tax=Streptomyces pimonensis TaxID=2860288 RepID=A0ABV4IZM9_9ACTN
MGAGGRSAVPGRGEGDMLTDEEAAASAAVDEVARGVDPAGAGPGAQRDRERRRVGAPAPAGRAAGVARDGRRPVVAGPGRTGIRAVRTAPEARGRGHAARPVRALGARFLARRERPLPRVAEPNADAIALCARIGFRARRQATSRGVRTP